MTEPRRHKPRVIIESPMFTRADGKRCPPAEVERNMRYLKRAVLDSLRRGEAPFASCLIYPQVLNDALPEERRLGIDAGLAWGDTADSFAVYADHGISDGTVEGLTRHEQNGMKGEYRHIGAEPEAAAHESLDLIDRLVSRLHSFVFRAAPLLRDGNGTAELTIMLHQPGGDEDGTLCLEAKIRETLELDGEEGRLPGVDFDVEPAA